MAQPATMFGDYRRRPPRRRPRVVPSAETIALYAKPFARTALVEEIEGRLRIDLPTFIEEAYFVFGMPEQEIADALGCSLSSVHLWRRRLRLPSFRSERRTAFEHMRTMVRRQAGLSD